MAGPAGVIETARRCRILIVDDQPTLAKAIRRMLAEHDVTVVSSAREAIALVAAGERFDAIVSDLMMPELGGIELYTELASIAPDQVDRMVFMTGGGFTDEARVFFEQVANPTLEKPFDRAALLAVLDKLLR